MRFAVERGSRPRGIQPLDQRSADQVGVFFFCVSVTLRAVGRTELCGTARGAGVEVGEARLQLTLERRQLGEATAYLNQLLLVHVTQFAGRLEGRWLGLTITDQRSDLTERQAQALQLRNPPDTNRRLDIEQTVVPLGAARRLDQPQLLVVVDSPDRFASDLGQ